MSDDLQDIAQGFHRSREERLEAWDESTAADICKRLGMPPAVLKRVRADLGPAFGCDWLNQLDLLPFHVLTHREFRFNFEEIFKKGQSHPLVKAFLEKRAEVSTSIALAVVVKVYDVGRVVLTDYDVSHPQFTSLTVRLGPTKLHIIHQPQFFDHFDQLAQDYTHA